MRKESGRFNRFFGFFRWYSEELCRWTLSIQTEELKIFKPGRMLIINRFYFSVCILVNIKQSSCHIYQSSWRQESPASYFTSINGAYFIHNSQSIFVNRQILSFWVVQNFKIQSIWETSQGKCQHFSIEYKCKKQIETILGNERPLLNLH